MTQSPEAVRDLVRRVESAVGADRELDKEVYRWMVGRPGDILGGAADEFAPAYTASLDAAMSLVPEGWGWHVNQPNAKALASGLLKERTPVRGEVENGCELRFIVAAATPALALVAASLRARLQGQADE